MRAGADRHQRVSASIVVIESSGKPCAFVDGQIELELVAGARRRVRPDGVGDHRAAMTVVDPTSPCRPDTRGLIEKSRKLGERDRLLVIEAAGRMSFMQELCDRRDWFRMGGRELAQIDLLSG